MTAPAVHVVAFRHGETTLNARGRLTGQLDPPLTARGREQAEALGAVVAGGAFDRYVHSGLRRAADTLAIAWAVAGRRDDVAPEADPRWRERSFGALAGARREAWTQPPDLDAAPPGGESFRALGARIVAALDDLARDAEAAERPLRVLLSAHSGVLRWLTALAAGDADGDRDGDGRGDPALRHFTGPGPANGAVVELSYTYGGAAGYAAPSTPTPTSRAG